MPPEETMDAPASAPAAAGLRQQAAERLAAHRLRRTSQAAIAAEPVRTARPGRHVQVAAAVAERFAQTQSYRAMLAEEARRAMEAAAAAAEVALRNAEAVHAAQTELLVELEKWTEPVKFTAESAVVSVAAPVAVKELSTAGLTVRLYEDAGLSLHADGSGVEAARRNQPVRRNHAVVQPDEHENRALDAEIAFRQAPVFEIFAPPEPAVAIAANLLEFPRQLVAAKKMRPRLAEGPLVLEEEERNPQLRIFEVQPQAPTAEQAMPRAMEWSAIWLDAQTAPQVFEHEDVEPAEVLASLLPPKVAPIGLRLMAIAVDLLLVSLGTIAFAAAAVRVAGAVPTGATGAIAAAATFAALYVSYQALFFGFSDATPGMVYARIGLCTFSDENPSRKAMRKRIAAQLVAICPFGLGVLWALLDDDRLGWHDRISRMYQRAY